MTYNHFPAMLHEAVSYLNCEPGKTIVDCTLGGCGHARTIIEKILPDGTLIGIDQDQDSITNAKEVLKPYHESIKLFHDNFVNLPEILSTLNIDAVDGILLDLGLSLHHIENSGRGFSFLKDEPLDMRMNPTEGETAADIINRSDEGKLVKLFYTYGEERWAPQIARHICMNKKTALIQTSRQLAELVREAVPAKAALKQKIHPATRVFMALRIAVNKELERIEQFIKNISGLLKTGGRICILSFHSLEDRIVKHGFKALASECTCPPDFPKCVCSKKSILKILTKKAILPGKEEIEANPMARSTKLRAAEKILS